jgi:uncharacterized protein (DUF342 family)
MVGQLAGDTANMGIEGLAFSEADGQLFVRGQAVAGRAAVDVAILKALIDDAGYAAWVIDDAGLSQAVEDCNHSQTPFVIPVAEKRDALIRIDIAADAMAAMVSIDPPQGGKPASIEDVLKALHIAGVTLGVDHATLLEACNTGIADQVTVAYGTPAQAGKDSDFVELVPQTSNRAPRVDENGLIDYREHSGISLVEPGAPLMRRVPAVPGVDGHTVRGQVLSPPPVRDEPFSHDLTGAAPSADDPELLTAAIAGAPVRVPGGVIVEPVLRVKEVNLATGNIYFDGSVLVEGDVLQNMKVQASGDIFVGGTVESATLEAQGNVTVKGGIIAESRVSAKGAVNARFSEASRIKAGTVIGLDDAALGCELLALNQILVGIKYPQRGRLVGGSATAKMLLKVPELGSAKAGVTRVSVGVDPELEQRYKDLAERLDKEKANEENLQKLCAHLVSIKDPKGMLERARTSYKQAAQAWGKSLVEKTELDKLRKLMLNARLEVGLGTSGPVELMFGSLRMPLRKEYKAGSFSIGTDMRINFTGPDGKAFPAA